MSKTVQLLGISNAIVDILAHVEEAFLEQIGAPPGSMILIDVERAHEIYDMMGPATEMSGGSVASSVAGFANLGGSAAYVGRVADDQLGSIFIHDMRSLGVDVRLPAETRGAPTARCHVLITPDGQRTMQTYLGACTELNTGDINEATVGAAEVMLLEGYLWDTPQGPEAAAKAMDIAVRAGTTVALSLSDDQCVLRHHRAFTDALAHHVKMVFANEAEIMALLSVDRFDAAVAKAAEHDALFVLTRSENGSVIVRGSDRVVQPARHVAKVVDTTGAGDAFTAAFLYGFTSGKSLAECAELGTICASAVIQQIGGRVEPDALAAQIAAGR
jgi:sugar/nucleoside kinase (ribokinase family)